jgi:hypothetical protein
LEIRKWRIVLLQNALQQLPDDPIYGMVAITEFWSKFDFPSDGPLHMSGDKYISPEYYQKQFYDNTIASHEDWVLREINRIRASDIGVPV